MTDLVVDGRNAAEKALAVLALLASREERTCLLGLPQAAVAASSGSAASACMEPACAASGVQCGSVSNVSVQTPAWRRLHGAMHCYDFSILKCWHQ